MIPNFAERRLPTPAATVRVSGATRRGFLLSGMAACVVSGEAWAAFSDAAGPAVGDPPWLKWALSELGVSETADRQNQRILEYLATVFPAGHQDIRQETSWCSAFANWCFERAGLEGSGRANARSWLGWGAAVSDFQRGDVLAFWIGDRDDGVHGQTAFFLGLRGTEIEVVAGHIEGRVAVTFFPIERLIAHQRLVPA